MSEMETTGESTELCPCSLSSSEVHQTTQKRPSKLARLQRGKLLLVLFFTYLTYIILGGVIFHFIEFSYREKTAIDPESWIDQILSNKTCLTREDLLSIVKDAIGMSEHGVKLRRNGSLQYSHSFDLGSSVFFSTSLVTTIGYGNIIPITLAGRIFAVFFAFIGVPLFFATSAEFGQKLHKLCLTIFGKFKFLAKFKERGVPITLIIMTFGGFSVYCLLAAIIFSVYEGWTYVEALYYTVITLATIGFGDYYPAYADGGANSKPATFYRIFVTLWILSGLVWMASMIAGASKVFREFLVGRMPDDEPKTETLSNGRVYKTFTGS